jgi:mRNA interferase RelE/StbE
MYRLLIKPSAERDLDRLRGEMWQRVKEAILALRADPRPTGCKKLAGGKGWRIPIGDYRALYDIDDDAQTVTILRVRHRRDVYRNL